MDRLRRTILTILSTAVLLPFTPGLARAQNSAPPDTTGGFPLRVPIGDDIGSRNQPNRGGSVVPFREMAEADRLQSEGRFQEAVDILEPLWRNDPDNEALAGSLKRAYRRLKNYDGMIAILRRQLDTRPGSPITLSEMANAFFGAGAEDSAQAALTRLIAGDPKDAERRKLAAEAYVRSGRYVEGIGVYRQARIDLDDPVVFAQDLARLLEARREYEAAVDEYFRWLIAKPSSHVIVQKHITNLVKVPGAAEPITEALREIVLKSPDHEYAHRLYGDLLFESNSTDSAFAEYHRADALAEKPGGHRLFGIKRALETGHNLTARNEAVAFLRDYPTDTRRTEIHFNQARAELGLGHPLIAIDLLRELAGQMPNVRERSRMEYEIGEIFRHNTDHIDSAKSYFQKVVNVTGQVSNERVMALLRLGDIYTYYGDLAMADSSYQTAAKSTPPSLREEVAYRRAELMFLTRDYEGAATGLKDLAKRFPRGLYVNDALELGLLIREGNDAMSWSLDRYAAALLAFKQKDTDSSLALLELLAADSANALADDALFAAAEVQVGARSYDAALALYQSLIVRFPKSFLVPRAWLAIGDLNKDGIGDIAAARAAYQTLLAEFKQSPVVETARHRLQRLDVP